MFQMRLIHANPKYVLLDFTEHTNNIILVKYTNYVRCVQLPKLSPALKFNVLF